MQTLLDSFQFAYDPLPEAILLTDKRGKILVGNQKAFSLLGKAPSDLINTNMSDHLLSHQDISAYIEKCYHTSQPLPGSFSFNLPDNKILACRFYGCRLKANANYEPLMNFSNDYGTNFVLLRLIEQEKALAAYRFAKERREKAAAEIHRDREAEKNKDLAILNEHYEFEGFYKSWLFNKYLQDLKAPLDVMYEYIQQLSKTSPSYTAEKIQYSLLDSFKLISALESFLNGESATLPLSEEIIKVEILINHTLKKLKEKTANLNLKFKVRIQKDCCLLGNYKIIQKGIYNLLESFIEFHTGENQIKIEAHLTSIGKMVLKIYDSEDASIIANLPETADDFLSKRYQTRINKDISTNLYLSKKILEVHGGKLLYHFHHNDGSIINVIFPAERIRTQQKLAS